MNVSFPSMKYLVSTAGAHEIGLGISLGQKKIVTIDIDGPCSLGCHFCSDGLKCSEGKEFKLVDNKELVNILSALDPTEWAVAVNCFRDATWRGSGGTLRNMGLNLSKMGLFSIHKSTGCWDGETTSYEGLSLAYKEHIFRLPILCNEGNLTDENHPPPDRIYQNSGIHRVDLFRHLRSNMSTVGKSTIEFMMTKRLSGLDLSEERFREYIISYMRECILDYYSRITLVLRSWVGTPYGSITLEDMNRFKKVVKDQFPNLLVYCDYENLAKVTNIPAPAANSQVDVAVVC